MPQSGIETQMFAKITVQGDEGREVADGDVVGQDLKKGPEDMRVSREVVIQIVAPDIVFVVGEANQRL